jgi:hypothetical protein
MFSVENRVGRLVEVRMRAPSSSEEVLAFAAVCKREMTRAIRKHPGKLAVVVSDLRGMALLSPQLFSTVTEVMRGNNAMCERIGQLSKPTAVGAMQADRALREAGHTERRNFGQAQQLTAYLNEVLTPQESARLEAFLAEYTEAAAT